MNKRCGSVKGHRSAKERRSPIAVACLSNGSFSLGNSRKSRVRQVKLGDVAPSTSQSVVRMPSTRKRLTVSGRQGSCFGLVKQTVLPPRSLHPCETGFAQTRADNQTPLGTNLFQKPGSCGGGQRRILIECG
ncbi:hypothetical protein J2793_007303 [Paraburkholderia caledonica]|uniref:Uncharacterized protein n=1 Tax=Paraburkholderia caledonica TaxID=134536 RepID=A0AB73IPA6_9BURK|nr:hypothetical protein [Paraburkholderia caledonica]